MAIPDVSEKLQAHIPFFLSLPSGLLEDILTRVGSSGRGILKHVSKSLRNAVLEYRVAEGHGDLDHLKFSKKWHPSLVRSTAPNVSRSRTSLTGAGAGHAIALTDLCVSVELLVWSRWQGAPWDDNRWRWLVCPLAAEGGHLESLVYATREGILLCPATCEAAAAGGRLGILKWAREMNCHWDGRTTAAAAEAGNLKILRWARDHGCPWDERVCEKAMESGHTQIATWAADNGCPCDSDTYDRIVQASARTIWDHLVAEGSLLSELSDALSESSMDPDDDQARMLLQNEPWIPPVILDVVSSFTIDLFRLAAPA